MQKLVEAISVIISYVKLRRWPRNRRISIKAVIKGAVSIGDYTYIGARTEIRGTLSRVTIGRYCSIGRDVKIFSAGQMHVFEGLSTYPFFTLDSTLDRRSFNRSGESTVIGNDVWIGSNAVIMAGVEVGDGSVVGAGSIVTKDVPAYSIVAGNPARVIKSRFDEPTRDRVTESRWWELDYHELKARFPALVSENVPVHADADW